MPYKNEYTKMKIPANRDNRRKLTEQEKDEIRELYGCMSQRKLAKAYGVSRRLVIFIGNPETLKENLRRRAEKGGSKFYYNTKANTKSTRKCRRRRQDMFLAGELLPNNNERK